MNLEKDFTLPKELADSLKEGASVLKEGEGVVTIVSHYDGDGLAAGSLLLRTLIREERAGHVTITRASSEKDIEDIIKGDKSKLFIFSDLGSSFAQIISKNLGGRKAIILDHHKLENNVEAENIVHINPSVWGIDGGREVCGATLSFLFSLAVDPENKDLVTLGLAGAYGDKQYMDGWAGINSAIVKFGKDNGLIEERVLPRLSGHSVEDAVARSNDPYFRGISGRIGKVREILSDIEIPGDLNIQDLSPSQLKSLNSLLIVLLLKQGVREEIASTFLKPSIFGTESSVTPGARIEDLNHISNACGREGETEVAVRLYMGDYTALKRGSIIRNKYRAKVLRNMMRIENKEAIDKGAAQYIYVPPNQETLCGAIAGLSMEYLLDQEKPTIGLSHLKDQKKIKISARGTNYLVKKGIDLASALAEASGKVGGNGGGHAVAAGATIALDKEEAFITELNNILSAQVGGG